MKRLLALLTLALIADVAVADIPPPPPPKGKKYVAVSNEVVLGKDVTGYIFVKQVTSFPGMPAPSYGKLELTAKKATPMPDAGRRTFVILYAIPQDAASSFKTDEALFAALGADKVKGAHKLGFSSTATVSTNVNENAVKWTHTITAIDAGGIKTKIAGAGYEAPKVKPGKDSPEEDSDAPAGSVQTPRGGFLIAGLSAFAALTLSGMWLAGRTRRKVTVL